jgi:hypothetical protein
MKTKSFIALSIGAICVVAALVSTLASPSNSRGSLGDGQHLEGSWLVTASVVGDPSLIKALLTCSPNGEVVETPSVPLAVSTGHGVWERTGNRQFALTVLYLRRDEAGGLIGTSKVRSLLSVNESMTEGSGRFETTVFDLAGNQVGAFEGTAESTRIQSEPLN